MPRVAECTSDEDDCEGDITGIIEADGLALEDLPPRDADEPLLKGVAWRHSALTLRAPRPAVVEDEDGDLVVARQPDSASAADAHPVASCLVGTRFELRRVTATGLARVGLQLWAGALVLSDLLLARPELVAGKHTCELGAGLGLCSMVAARLGAASVLCSDGSLEAVTNCEENLRCNEGCESVRTAVVSWEDPPQAPALGSTDASVVGATRTCEVGSGTPRVSSDHAGALLWGAQVLLAADVIYDAVAAEALVGLVARLLSSNQGNGRAEALYLALEKRVYFSAATLKPEVAAYPQFLEDCQRHGLSVAPVDLTSVPVHFDYVRSRFYELVVVTADPQVGLEGQDPGAGGRSAEERCPEAKRRHVVDTRQ